MSFYDAHVGSFFLLEFYKFLIALLTLHSIRRALEKKRSIAFLIQLEKSISNWQQQRRNVYDDDAKNTFNRFVCISFTFRRRFVVMAWGEEIFD